MLNVTHLVTSLRLVCCISAVGSRSPPLWFEGVHNWQRNWKPSEHRLVSCLHLFFMMTSSNGNIFRVTGHLCGEFTGHRWIPHTKASDAELWCFFDLSVNKRLSKQSWGWWVETPWHSCHVLNQTSIFVDAPFVKIIYIYRIRAWMRNCIWSFVEKCIYSLLPGRNSGWFHYFKSCYVLIVTKFQTI